MSFVDFNSLGVCPDVIIGSRISINDILDKRIFIYKTKIDKSKFSDRNRSGLRMQMQIKIDGEGEFRSCFTGSDTLINMMREAEKREGFKYPLRTTIYRSGKMLVFT